MSSDEILTQLLNHLPDTYQKTLGFPMYDLLAAAAIQLAETDEYVQDMKLKLDPENLTGYELDRYIYPRSGLNRRQATFADGVVHVTGTGVVKAGSLFSSAGGINFSAIYDVDVSKEGDVPVCCMQDGTAGNLPAHTVTEMPVTIQGISTCDNPEPMKGGYNEESDSEYYERHLIKIQTPPTSGNVYHYLSWSLEVAGVGHAKVFPLGHGDNPVDVVLIGQDGKPADDGLVQSVQDYIDPESAGEGYGQAPIGARCFVSAANAKEISLSIRVVKDGSAESVVTSGSTQAVSKYMGEVAFKQDYISYAHIAMAILNASGVLDFDNLRLDGNTDNISIKERECAVLGEVNIIYA